MKFNENDNILIFPNIKSSIIYLLIDGDEVVYVGQSKFGLSRPYSHKDKKFTNVAVLECEENELDKKETEFIKKYKPKYNKKNGNYDYSFARAISIIKIQTNIHNFNIYDLRKLVNKFKIQTYTFDKFEYMNDVDFEKVFSFVKMTSEGIYDKDLWKSKVFG